VLGGSDEFKVLMGSVGIHDLNLVTTAAGVFFLFVFLPAIYQ